jgi:predicted amidophosphoribosyltransferase
MSTLYSPPMCPHCRKRSTSPNTSTCAQCADPVLSVGVDHIGALALCGKCGRECEHCAPRRVECGHPECLHDPFCHRLYAGVRE